MKEINVAGIIPARYGSSRLPGKPLALIGDKTMIQHVYERCAGASLLDYVCVATDDERVYQCVRAFGGQVVMTRADHCCGTDRIAEVAKTVPANILVNIQGDQPFVHPEMIDESVRPLLENSEAQVSTLMKPVITEEDMKNPAVVKVVFDLSGKALYFSRSLIPYPRENTGQAVYEHIGIYAYRNEVLQRLTSLKPTGLERTESLEQLRWLENGIHVQVNVSMAPDHDFCGFSVDTPDDLRKAGEMWLQRAATGY